MPTGSRPRALRVVTHSLHREGGQTVIEVLVSAMLVLIIAVAILGSIDGASKTSGRLTAQATAANLAQQDLERLRAMRIGVLGNLQATRSVTVDGATYSVKSQGTYVSERTETPGCTSTSTADYIRITSTVNANALRSPITLSSMVNPAVGSFNTATGGVVVQITNAAGNGVSGIPVTITGPGTFTQDTSTDGCAFFAYVPVGSYTMSYSLTGWIDMSGTSAISMPVTVQADQTASYSTTYDRAGRVDATIKTRLGATTMTSNAEAITVTHPNLPGTGARSIAAPTGLDSLVPATNLFPFSSPYAIYTGTCPSNPLPSSLVSQLPTGTYTTSQIVAPGQTYPVTLFQPAINLKVTLSTGGAVSGARVYLTSTNPSCSAPIQRTTDSAGGLAVTKNSAVVSDPGVPYDTYTVCADYLLPSKGFRSKATGTVTTDAYTGKALNLTIPANPSSESKCA